ncbi:MAG: NF038122 family metalloprotease, partial [Bacteroidota bacterium]
MNDFGLDSGTQFDFTYAPGTSTEQIIGFEMAGQVWSSYLDDDITVRIYVESTDQLPEDVVGAALPAKKKKADLNNLRKKLVDDATSSDDAAALLNLPSLDNEFSIVVDGRELEKTKDVRFTNANAKALDLLNDEPDKLDGYILVNDLTGQSTAGWNYDASRITSNGGVDFLSVAMHEIGHVLGFVSGIDDDGWLEVLTKAEREEKELKDDAFKFASPLDLFRYSDNDLAAGKIDLSTGGNPYFSIDGGETNLASFSSGEYTDRGGDGYQASHWQNGSGLGIMNPILRAGEIKDISSLDLKAMDV